MASGKFERGGYDAKLVVVWCILLLPWFLIAPVSAMAFDDGAKLSAYVFVWSVWTYPIPVVFAAVFREKWPKVTFLPLLNVIGVLVSGWGR